MVHLSIIASVLGLPSRSSHLSSNVDPKAKSCYIVCCSQSIIWASRKSLIHLLNCIFHHCHLVFKKLGFGSLYLHFDSRHFIFKHKPDITFDNIHKVAAMISDRPTKVQGRGRPVSCRVPGCRLCTAFAGLVVVMLALQPFMLPLTMVCFSVQLLSKLDKNLLIYFHNIKPNNT